MIGQPPQRFSLGPTYIHDAYRKHMTAVCSADNVGTLNHHRQSRHHHDNSSAMTNESHVNFSCNPLLVFAPPVASSLRLYSTPRKWLLDQHIDHITIIFAVDAVRYTRAARAVVNGGPVPPRTPHARHICPSSAFPLFLHEFFKPWKV